MRDLLVLFLHFLATLARLLGPGGTRAVIAETLLIKHQLVVLNRSRQRVPNLTATDRIVMGLFTLFMNPGRIRKVAAALQPTTLLGFSPGAEGAQVPPPFLTATLRQARTQRPFE